jgi:hypothetical protein
MAGFDAGSAVEPMDYDFTTTPGGKGKGVVPEPSTTEMKNFQTSFARIMRDAGALEMSDEEAAKLSEGEFDALQEQVGEIGDRLDAAIAKLCKDTPSVDEVSTLPFRVKTAFSKWLMEQFAPEGGTSGTKK